MKKINIAILAAVLVAAHIGVFLAFVGCDRKAPMAASAAGSAAAPAPVPALFEPLPDPLIDSLSEPAEAESVVPVAVAEMPRGRPLEPIARPGSREGHLRADRSGNRTTRVYPQLVSDPYVGAIVVDARSGKILFEQRAGAFAYPASITKLMTLLVVLEQIDKGVVGLHDKVAFTPEGMGVGGSQAYLDIRESGAFSVDDLLKALAIHSANDAARVLGIHVAGSKEAFLAMMNQKARELGMNSTTYHTEHGLPPRDGSQPDISTAYDTALLCMACLRHPETLRYTGTKLDYLPLSPLRKERFMLANRNTLVRGGTDGYEGCDGLKTGYHGMGGWSLAATAQRDGRRVLSVVLGSPDRNTRNAISRKLLDQGFQALEKR